jgi:FkbM family methyltransferase
MNKIAENHMSPKNEKKMSGLRLLKYRLFRHLPGMRGLRFDRTRGKALRNEQFAEALTRAQGTIGIDLGANLGKYTRLMAEHCSNVLAFEPDPCTAEQLRANTSDLTNVTIIEAAASISEGMATLYRRSDFGGDNERASEGSTIFAEKTNVDDRYAVLVRQLDFITYLREQKGKVGILKIDIEGAEVDLLEALIKAPDLLNRIAYLFVETHENRIPSQKERVARLKRWAMKTTCPIINLYWN